MGVKILKYDFSTVYDRRLDGSRKWENLDTNVDFLEEKIIPMTVADLEFPMCSEIKEGLKNYIDNSFLGYSNPTNNYLISVKKHMKALHDFELEEEWVVTTPGIVPALATGVRAYSEIGDGVIVFSPVYYPFYDIIRNQKREVLNCDLNLINMRYEINYENLEELARKDNTKIILLCSPHNPGGRVWTKEELWKISKIAEKHDLVVISDEIHADLALGDTEHTIYGDVGKAALEHSIICTSASKMYNIAGLQASNIIIPNENLREQFVSEHTNVGIQVSNVLGMKATEIAYNTCSNWRKEMMAVLKGNIDYTISFLKDLDQRYKVMKPDASFLVWVNISEFNVGNEVFIKQLEENCQIYVTDGLIYGEKGNGWIRLNVGMPKEELENTLERFKELPL